MISFPELKVRSNTSFLRGASHPEELVAQAEGLGLEAIALTDLNGVYGLPRAYESVKHHNKIKLICGVELTIAHHSNLHLLARNRAAYGVMCQLITQAHANKPKGEAVLQWEEIERFSDQLGFSSLVAYPNDQGFLDHRLTDFNRLKALFKKRLYLPLTRYFDGRDDERTDQILKLSRAHQIDAFATNDVYYHTRSRSQLQDVLTSIREQTPITKAGFHLFSNDERYLRSPLEMARIFRDVPRAIECAHEIASSCTFQMAELKYRYPSEWIPDFHTGQSYLEELTWIGAQERYKGLIPDAVKKQIHHEFKLIQELGYADYFLTVYDIVRFARQKNILCQGRGSAANSVICYCLGITAIDPVQMNLLFERFISRERAEPPDIDVDFEHNRREEVIQYIYQRYGRDRAAMVSAVVKYQGRNSFLEVSKALGVEVGVLSAQALDRDFESVAKDRAHLRPVINRLVDEIDGFPRHLSIHSGGFTLSADDLSTIVPIEPARMEGRTICQWDKNDLDCLGLLKIDVLSLGALTALHEALDLVGLQFHEVPHDDPKTYHMIRAGQTEGTFQIESRAQKASLVRTLPENFGDLVTQVAIVRPGPTVGQMVHPYILRRQNARRGTPYDLPDPRLTPVLGRTYGVPIFQEQIMKIAIEFAGFTPGEADQLRRAIAAWRSAGPVTGLGDRLRQGLLANGVPAPYAEELFTYLKGFSEYGFPESHAASFALIAYATAYLKCHHPAEFLCALINAQPMGFYSVDTLIHEAQRRGVEIFDIDPHRSIWNAQVLTPGSYPGTLQMGFRTVHGIREVEVQTLVQARGVRGFSSLDDFILRSGLSRNVIHSLALANTFECFGYDQRHTVWHELSLNNLTNAPQNPQIGLFEQQEGVQSLIFRPMSEYEEVLADYRAKGFSVEGNLMALLRRELPNLPPSTSQVVKAQKDGSPVAFAGAVLVMQRPPPARGTAFITLEDDTGTLDLIVWSSVYERYREIICNGRFLIIRGTLQKKEASLSVIASHFEAFDSRIESHKIS